MKARSILLGMAAVLSAVTANAQYELNQGGRLTPKPEDRPYVYFDQLRLQQPYIHHQFRINVNSNNWQELLRYYTDKNAAGDFTRIYSEAWNSQTNGWSSDGNYRYQYTKNAANNVTERNLRFSSDFFGSPSDIRSTITYDAAARPATITTERSDTLSANYQVISREFLSYDVLGRLAKDSTDYLSSYILVLHYAYTGDSLLNVACLSHTPSGVDTVEAMVIRKDAAGRMTKYTDLWYDNGAASGFGLQQQYTYDAAGRIAQYEEYFIDTLAPGLSNSQKLENHYRPDGQLDYWVSYYADASTPSGWEIDYKLVLEYGNDNKADTAFSYFWLPGSNMYNADAEQRLIFKNPTLTTGILPPPQSLVCIYPNPARDRIVLKGLAEARNQLIISNAAGQVVHNELSSAQEINVSSLPTGNYFLTINGTQTLRFIKE